MEKSSECKPIRELKPLNIGGVSARSGFNFQDHVAVNFCLQMVSDSEISEVWCETHDDITLIKSLENGKETVEFIQVKDININQLWSIAKLCERQKPNGDSKKEGISILEKSLTQERCTESSSFRIITSLGVNKELEFLSFPFSSPRRIAGLNEANKLVTQIEDKLGKIKSPKGNSIQYWVENALWQIEHTTEAVKNKNLNILSKIISKTSVEIPLSITEESIYPNLLFIVKNAAEANPDIIPEEKKIFKPSFISKINSFVDEIKKTNRQIAGNKLIEKMEKASIPNDYIENALEERIFYRKEKLEPQYLELTDHELIEAEVIVTLENLRLELDTGKIEPGLPFYKQCVTSLDNLRETINTKAHEPKFYFHGCMHDRTDRCGHRYHKEQL